MSFDRPWMLIALIVPLLWITLNWRRSPRHQYVLAKGLCLCLLVLAMSGLALVHRGSRMIVTVLADVSGSLMDQDLKHESDLIRAMEHARRRNTLRVIPFARSAGIVGQPEQIESRSLVQIPGAAGLAGDIERALHDAIGVPPAGSVPRIVILSDGRENATDVLRSAEQAKLLAIPIDTIPLAGAPWPSLLLEMAAIPTVAYSFQPIGISLVITSPRPTGAEIVFFCRDKELNSSRVFLEKGLNRVRVTTRLAAVGRVDLSVAVRAGDVGELRFSAPLTLRQPRALLVSLQRRVVDPHLTNSLASAHFQLRRAANVPARLADYEIVLLNDWNLQTIPLARKAALEKFVKDGGLLGVIAPQQQDLVRAGNGEGALERVLPARLVPAEPGLVSCFVLVLQKSSSMEGKNMELARLAALEIVENLRRNDKLGVLTFNDTFEWTAPIDKAIDKDATDSLIEGVTVGGGTRIGAAVGEAFRVILAVDAAAKHIILLTDGRAEDVDSLVLARQAAERHVTISALGIGGRENSSYLTTMAQRTGGDAYIISTPWELESEFLHEISKNARSSALWINHRPAVEEGSQISAGTTRDFASLWNASELLVPKSRAQILVSRQPADLGLIRWQYGLGQAEIITRQAERKARSSAPSTEVNDVWENVASDFPKGTPRAEVTAEYDKARDEFTVDYRFRRHVRVPATGREIFVFGLHGFGSPVPIKKVADAVFRARVRFNNNSGLFRVVPLSESSAFPQVQLYRHDQEIDDRGSNLTLLKRISELTGGRFDPGAGSIFDPSMRTAARKVRLWPGLVLIAVVLFLLDRIPRRQRHVLPSFEPEQSPVLGGVDRQP